MSIRRGVVVAVIALALVGLVVAWALGRDDPQPGNAAGDTPPSAGATPAPTASPSQTGSASAQASQKPDESAKPDGSPKSGGPASDPPTTAPSQTPSDSGGGGNVVPYAEVTPEPAIGIRETADFGTGLTLHITSMEAVQGEARGPGEVAGPAVQFRLQAENASRQPIPLDGMTITVTYGDDKTPASALSEPDGVPFSGELGAGESAEASYNFAVPVESRDSVQVTASYTGAAPMVVLAGSAS
ncbi:hypothetical protein [Nocardioides insulae]|uniref:hypothetical protein n=1 Tax=Nocardioides insulae TaxID=394734 RepID=UPI000403E007|nr:hypothetical protein [Nocardioides insulae]